MCYIHIVKLNYRDYVEPTVLSSEMVVAYEKNIKGNQNSLYNRAVINAANVLQAFNGGSTRVRQSSCNSQSISYSGIPSSSSINGSFEALEVLERIELS